MGPQQTKRLTPELRYVIISASHSIAITAEKYCVKMACRNLDIFNPFFQTWNIALSRTTPSEGHSNAIASEECCVTTAGRNHEDSRDWAPAVGRTNEPKLTAANKCIQSLEYTLRSPARSGRNLPVTSTSVFFQS